MNKYKSHYFKVSHAEDKPLWIILACILVAVTIYVLTSSMVAVFEAHQKSLIFNATKLGYGLGVNDTIRAANDYIIQQGSVPWRLCQYEVQTGQTVCYSMALVPVNVTRELERWKVR